MSAHEQHTTALIKAGQRDLLALQLFIEPRRAPHETIGFHARQAAEKFLKAELVHHGVIFYRTDDLIVHHELLEQRAVQVPAAKERLRALNSHAVQFRYEGCPAENVSSSECHVLTSSLEK